MTDSKLRLVIAIIVDTKHITLFADTGEVFQFNQGAYAVKRIMSEYVPELTLKHQVIVDIHALQTDEPNTDVYKEYESKSKLVRFFSVAKAKLDTWFSTTETEKVEVVEPRVIGGVPEVAIPVTITEPTITTTTVHDEELTACSSPEPIVEVVKPKPTPTDILMEDAKPVGSAEFTQTASLQDKHNTLVAMIEGKVVPDVENLSAHIKHANASPSVKGMDKFFVRAAKTSTLRKHSAKDLMAFMKTADLPISNEGMIIAYKNLNCLKRELRKEVRELVDLAGRELLTLEDIHSGTIPQGAGAIVCMDEKLVDDNRRVDCSHGLHIASRSYLGSFHGAATVACYIDPADVMAVPENSTTKMRVAKYTIAVQLSEKLARVICGNTTAISQDEEAKTLLQNLISHSFPKPVLKVTQTATGIEYKDLVPTLYTKEEVLDATQEVLAKSVTEVHEEEHISPTVDPSKLTASVARGIPKKAEKPTPYVEKAKKTKKVKKAKTPKVAAPKADVVVGVKEGLSRRELLTSYVAKGDAITKAEANEVIKIKKAMKKGWGALGVTEERAAFILALSK